MVMMAVAVGMTVAVPMTVFVIMGVRMSMVAISAAFRLEWLHDLDRIAAKAARHIRQNMVAANENAIRLDLGRGMPVAKMPGEAHQAVPVRRGNRQQGFRLGAYDEPAPVFRLQAAAIRHRDGLRQVEQDSLAIACLKPDAATMPGVEIEGDFGDGLGGRPVAGRGVLRCAVHRSIRT